MSRAPATPLHAARRAAAKELALPITDWRVIRLATLVCAHDAVQARLANGASVDVDHLLKLDAALAKSWMRSYRRLVCGPLRLASMVLITPPKSLEQRNISGMPMDTPRREPGTAQTSLRDVPMR